MKRFIILISILLTNIYAIESIEVIKSLNENPTKNYSKSKKSNSTDKIVENVKNKVSKTISSDKLAQIKEKLKSLHKKINSDKHALKLKYKAKLEAIEKIKNGSKAREIERTKRLLKHVREHHTIVE